MSNTITSPNMNLALPIPGQDPGPDYANNQNAAFLQVDSHNHTSGKGSLIPPAGLNINTSLPMQGNFITNLGGLTFKPQILTPAINSLYVSGVDLYYYDGNGDTPIQITSGGAVNATSSGISSGTASASFISNVLVVNSASLTPANIQGASLLIGQSGVSSSNYITLSPPSALSGGSYPLVLPATPASTLPMTLDSSGNMGTALLTGSQIAATTIAASNIVANTITASQIANATITTTQISASAGITGSQIAANTITPSNMASISAPVTSGGSYSNNTSSFTNIVSHSFTCPYPGTRPQFYSFGANAITVANTTASTYLAVFQINNTTDSQLIVVMSLHVPPYTTMVLPPGSFNYSGVTPALTSTTATYALQGYSNNPGLTISCSGLNFTQFQI